MDTPHGAPLVPDVPFLPQGRRVPAHRLGYRAPTLKRERDARALHWLFSTERAISGISVKHWEGPHGQS